MSGSEDEVSDPAAVALKCHGQMPPARSWLREEIAYIAPMAVFLALVQVAVSFKSLYAPAYIARAILTAILLAIFWRNYTKIRWHHWWLGILVGVIGTVQWIGMQLWLQNHFDWFRPSPDAFNPMNAFHSQAAMWSFIAVRMIGAVLVVPVMEELFWRDYLWRQISSPNDFKIPPVGEWDPIAFAVVCGVFATVHGNWWLTAIVWAAMIGALLVYTKSLGACIIAHATTNLLLALYVLKYHVWDFW